MNGLYQRLASGIALAGMLFIFASTAVADDHSSENTKDVYSLSASATAEADNDWMQTTATVQHEDSNSAALANRVNADMQWALARMKPFTSIKARTTNYQTYPTYSKKGAINGWRASQSLVLETDDVEAAGDAIKRLQERLQIVNMHFSPKPETRQMVEDQLINEALDRFKKRALLIQLNMGKPGYSVLQVAVQTDANGGHFPQQRNNFNVRAESSMQAPALQAGGTQITVHVNGTVQLGTP